MYSAPSHCTRALSGAGLVLLVACTAPGKGKTAFVDALLFDGSGSAPIPNATLIVSGSRIERMGPAGSVSVPRGATVIHLDGKWVVPGLIDGHTHVERWTLPRYLASGVTAVRDVGGITDSLVALRSEIGSGATAGPRLFISGAMIDGAPATWPDATEVFKPEDARRAVDRLVLADVSQVKVYTKVDRRLLEAVLDEAKTLNVPVTAHLGKVDAVTAARMGVSAIEHLSGVVESSVRNPAPFFRAHDDFFTGWIAFERGWAPLDSATLDRTARALIGSKVTIIPTLIQHQTYAFLEDSAYANRLDLTGVPADVRKDWDIPGLVERARLKPVDYPVLRRSRPVENQFVRIYAREGGRVVVGTDSPNQLIAPGASLHEEMALLVEAGLSPTDALLAATRDAARLLGIDSLGVLAAGKPADFIVLGGNPLQDVANTKRVERVVQFGVDRTVADLRQGW
ncbi:MAG: amidohydrolase family protein [Gemmatimonadetes bacterium]|nr:amidohydrolase family protein [Gemmatimonadota bacterium]